MTDLGLVLDINDLANRLIDAHEQQQVIINELIQATYDYTAALEKQVKELSQK